MRRAVPREGTAACTDPRGCSGRTGPGNVRNRKELLHLPRAVNQRAIPRFARLAARPQNARPARTRQMLHSAVGPRHAPGLLPPA
jgi:hypothetical protein